MTKTTPDFMLRMRARREARKEATKQEQLAAEAAAKEKEHNRKLVLALGIVAALIKPRYHTPHAKVRKNTKDVWSHLGDAVFGRLD